MSDILDDIDEKPKRSIPGWIRKSWRIGWTLLIPSGTTIAVMSPSEFERMTKLPSGLIDAAALLGGILVAVSIIVRLSIKRKNSVS